MKKSIDSLAALSPRQAQGQMAIVQRELKSLRNSISAMGRGIKAPVIRSRRKMIKGSSTASIWGGIAGIADTFLVDNGFYGDMGVTASGKVTIGGMTYSRSASSMGGDGADYGGGYASASQSASSAIEVMAQGQRNR